MSSDLTEIEILETLVSLPACDPQPVSLFEALNATSNEQSHSLYLAWLLSPRGPLTDYCLLRRLFETIGCVVSWPGTPLSVVAEDADGTERPDIVISWRTFKLIIEYKVFSDETDGQVERYRSRAELSEATKGMVLYLTPSGELPRSIDGKHPCVATMSYRKLRALLVKLESDVGTEAQVFLKQYRLCLERVLNRSFEMSKPTISPATSFWAANHKAIAERHDTAIRQSAAFIDWFASEITQRLQQIIAPNFKLVEWDPWGIFLFTTSRWCSDKFEYGLVYAAEAQLGTRVLHEYEHTVGLRVQTLDCHDRDKFKSEQTVLSQKLQRAVRPYWNWPVPKKINRFYPLYRDVPFKSDMDWNEWADRNLNLIVKMATALKVGLDEFDPDKVVIDG